jgi:hypothetical protein
MRDARTSDARRIGSLTKLGSNARVMAAVSVMEAPSMATELIVKGQPRVQWIAHMSNLIQRGKSLLTQANFTNGAREASQSLMAQVLTFQLAGFKITLECLACPRRPTTSKSNKHITVCN